MFKKTLSMIIIATSICSAVSLSGGVNNPSDAIKDLSDTQKKGNQTAQKQLALTQQLTALASNSYIGISNLVFLSYQRNKLINNNFKIESLNETQRN
ncbi:hypothetical protein I7007_001299 [Campylobacter jejuni]|nr:hypothetical protein [Campylobacter jejuni]EGR9265316.1 hypothetical protein [Campylobacter jejuni]